MTRFDRSARRLVAASLVVVVLAFLIAAMLARADRFASLDHDARSFVRDGRSRALTTPMHVVSFLGSGYVLLPVTCVGSVVLWRRRHRSLARSLPAIGIGAAVVLEVIKRIVNKPRPSLRGYGFPSGHVFGATVFVVGAIYVLWLLEAPRRVQRAARMVGAVFVIAIGYSRLYLNAHWLSDVVAGLLAGVAFALVMMLVVDARLAEPGQPR